METSRRRVVAAAGSTALVGLAGCSTLTENAQLLVIENDTEETHDVEIVVNEAPEERTTTAATTTEGTSVRFVVDFSFEIEAGGRLQQEQVLPTDGEFHVVARAPNLETGRGSYVGEESVRVTLTDDGIDVSTFTPE